MQCDRHLSILYVLYSMYSFKKFKICKDSTIQTRRVASSILDHVSFLCFSTFPRLSRMNMASASLSHLVWAVQPLRLPRPAGLQIFIGSKVFALISTFLCLELRPPCPALLALLPPLPLVHPCSSFRSHLKVIASQEVLSSLPSTSHQIESVSTPS